MKLVNQLLDEVHSARMFLQHNKPEKIKLAIYINRITWYKLCRELYNTDVPSSNITLSGMRGEKDHIFGYSAYEVIGQDETPWNIVEIPEIPKGRRLVEEPTIDPEVLRGIVNKDYKS